MEIIEEIEKISEKMDNLQTYIDSLPNALSIVDSKISDLRHGIEHNVMTSKGCYRLFKEFKNLTIERRKIRNDMEISRALNNNINKLLNSREFLLHELKKTSSKLNQPYKNRVYTEEQMNYFLGKSDENVE